MRLHATASRERSSRRVRGASVLTRSVWRAQCHITSDGPSRDGDEAESVDDQMTADSTLTLLRYTKMVPNADYR